MDQIIAPILRRYMGTNQATYADKIEALVDHDSLHGTQMAIITGFPLAYFTDEMELTTVIWCEDNHTQCPFGLDRLSQAWPLTFLPEVANIHYPPSIFDQPVIDAIVYARRKCGMIEQVLDCDPRTPYELRIELLAAPIIIDDDKDRLIELLVDEARLRPSSFRFSSEILAFDFRFSASDDCYRHLITNNCPFDQQVCRAALLGGNPNLVDICAQSVDGMLSSPRALLPIIAKRNDDLLEGLYQTTAPTSLDLSYALERYDWAAVVCILSHLESVASIQIFGTHATPQQDYALATRREEIVNIVDAIFNDESASPNLKRSLVADTRAMIVCDDFKLLGHCSPEAFTYDNLVFALKTGYINTIKYAAEIGRLDTPNASGVTLLTYAMLSRSKADFDMLLDLGAQMNPDNPNCTSPLVVAAEHDSADLTESLLNTHKADVNYHSHTGHTPLVAAAMNGNQIIAKMLLANGANVNDSSSHGSTPLTAAIFKQHAEMTTLFLEHGADPNLMDGRGITPVAQAIKVGNKVLLQTLVNSGAIMSGRILTSQFTPLSYAAFRNDDQIVRYLLGLTDTGHRPVIDVNAVDTNGFTALHYAAKKSNVTMINDLLQFHPDLTPHNNDNETPLDLCQNPVCYNLISNAISN